MLLILQRANNNNLDLKNVNEERMKEKFTGSSTMCIRVREIRVMVVDLLYVAYCRVEHVTLSCAPAKSL